MPLDSASGTGNVSSTVKANETAVIGTAKAPIKSMMINSIEKI
jgi:hypothetical protein